MTCPGGVYLFTLMEWHTASWAILLIGMGEIVIFSWVYGMKETFDLIHEMGMKFGKVLKMFWRSVWVVITPIGSVAIFIFILTDLGSTEFRGYVFPGNFNNKIFLKFSLIHSEEIGKFFFHFYSKLKLNLINFSLG